MIDELKNNCVSSLQSTLNTDVLIIMLKGILPNDENRKRGKKNGRKSGKREIF